MFEIIVIVVFCLLISLLVQYEQGTVASMLLLAVALGSYYLPLPFKPIAHDVVSFISTNPGTIIGGICLYITIGILYSFLKWYYYISDYKERTGYTDIKAYPRAVDKKATIIRWGSYWIFNFWITLIDRPLKAIVSRLGYAYDGFTKKIIE